MKWAVMTTWKHKNPIDWDDMKASVPERPGGTTVQWFEIDRHTHGSLVTFESKEIYDSIKSRQEAYRSEQISSREVEMTMEAVGPIHVEKGID